jgi:DNA-binding transcriptional ArsR family regulator
VAKRSPTREEAPSFDPIYEEVRAVRDLVEQVIGVLTYTAQDPGATQRREEKLRAFFGRGTRRADVYLALNQDQNITELAESLAMKRQNVSREIGVLKDAGLAVPFHTGGRGDVWIRNPVIEAVVGLSRKLQGWMTPDGPAVPMTKRRQAH